MRKWCSREIGAMKKEVAVEMADTKQSTLDGVDQKMNWFVTNHLQVTGLVGPKDKFCNLSTFMKETYKQFSMDIRNLTQTQKEEKQFLSSKLVETKDYIEDVN